MPHELDSKDCLVFRSPDGFDRRVSTDGSLTHSAAVAETSGVVQPDRKAEADTLLKDLGRLRSRH